MHAVLGLVEDLRLLRLEHVVFHFHLRHAEALRDVGAGGGVGVVEGRQAVQEDSLLTSVLHDCGGYLVRSQVADTLLPYLVRLTHGYPYVGTDNISVPGCLLHILSQGNGCTGFFCVLLTLCYQLRIREIFLRCACHKVETQFGADDHQGVAHVVAGIAHVYKLNTF